MKSYFKRNNLLVFTIVVILLLVLTNVFQQETKGLFYSFSAPIQQSLWQAGDSTSDFFEGLLRFARLNNKIDKLEQKNQGLIARIIELNEIKEENKTLRQALNIGLQEEYKLLIAKIIFKDMSKDIILINKGAKDNISENMTVITENKVLVGTIKQVFEGYSKVMLASNKDMSFDVRIKQEEKEVPAIAQGNGDLKIILNLIPLKEGVSQGDIVETSSMGGIFPGSLLIGSIKNVKQNDVDPFQSAEIENALNIFKLKNVFIIND